MFDLENCRNPSKINGLRYFSKFSILWKEDGKLKI